MARLAGITAAALLLAAGGQATAWAQGGKAPKLAPVLLSVEIFNDDTAGMSGDGQYVDGVDGTRASIDQYGNVIIAFGRLVNFNFSQPLDGVQDARAESGAYSGSYISTLANGLPLQNLAVGQEHCIRMNWMYDIPGGWLRLGFHRASDLNDPDNPDQTSYAVARRLSSTQWEIEPKTGTCGTFLNPDSVASVFTQTSVRGKWVIEEVGDYRMPFRLVLTKK